MDDALVRFRRLLGSATDWESLWRYLPDTLGGGVVARSALASTFAASLELAREGALTLRQGGTYSPIYLRARNRGDGGRS